MRAFIDWGGKLWRHGGIMLKVGQVLYDNDPRYRGRRVQVVRIEGSYAFCLSGPRQVKVRLDYIFSDDKPRRSGYSTVAEDGSLTTKAASLPHSAEQRSGTDNN
jgi:hypothetical protein